MLAAEDTGYSAQKGEQEEHGEQEDAAGNVLGELRYLINAERQNRMEEYSGEEKAAYLDEEYSYFHPERLFDGLSITDEVMNKARELIEQGKCGRLIVNTGFSSDPDRQELIGMAQLFESSRDYYIRWQCEIEFDRGGVREMRCSSWGCGGYSGCRRAEKSPELSRKPCEHLTAALILLENYLKEHKSYDATDTGGASLLTSSREGLSFSTPSGMEGGDKEGKPRPLITIEPQMLLDEYTHLYANFRIGERKLLAIRKLRETVECINEGKEQIFGSKTVLKLSRSRIGGTSLKWLEFIEDTLEEETQHYEHLRDAYGVYDVRMSARISNNIPLYGEKLDRFYQLCREGEVGLLIKSSGGEKEKFPVSFRDVDYRLHTRVEAMRDPKGGGLDGVRVTGELPEILNGRKYGYYLDRERKALCRIPEESSRRLSAVRKSAGKGALNISIGRRHLPEFMDNTLPLLKEMGEVDFPEEEAVNTYVPPKPEIICYMDVIGESVVCSVEAWYGGQGHFLTDRILVEGEKAKKYASYRDGEAEVEALKCIYRYFPNMDRENNVLYCQKGDEQLYLLLTGGLKEIMEYADVRTTLRFRNLKVRKKISFDMGLSVESNIMNLTISSSDLSEEELLEILSQYRKKRSFVRLKNGDFVSLEDNETLSELESMMDTLHVSPGDLVRGKMNIPVYRAFYLDKMLENLQDVYTRRDRYYKSLIRDFRTVDDSEFEVPERLKGIMRRYQVTGYRWLRTLDRYGFGGILADDMGLGKTLQAIAVFSAVKSEEGSAPALVACPASLVYNWYEEIRRFAPELKTTVISGAAADRKLLIISSKDSDVLVTSYDLLKRDIDAYEGREFRFCVADEAQYIKNRATAAAKSIKLIRARTHYALTGTPIENRLSELWSIFDFLMPGFLYDYADFRIEFETPIVKFQDEEASLSLRRMASSFVLRRLKKDVLKDLPEKLEEVRFAKMEVIQQRLYDAQALKIRDRVASQDEHTFNSGKIELLAELTRIRQICCDPSLAYENYKGESAKKDLCMELVKNLIEGEHKALIFSQFTTMLEHLEAELDKKGIAYYKIVGSTPKEKRMALVKQFNQDDTPLFLISLKAGGTGLNLVGADVVIHYDPWWNVAVQNQATDRAHRIGQDKIVTVYKLIVKGTIEEKILEMQEAKRKLAEDILGGEGMGSAAFNREELLELLS